MLDGGLATELEAHGHDLSDRLWSARVLRDDPDAVVAAHRAYFDAGAEVAITASYQATREGFAATGMTVAETDALIASSVELARRAAQQHVTAHGSRPLWVAGSVGPYGAMLGGGEEYTGAYTLSVEQLREFHRPRMLVLRDAGADVLALETMPQLAEVEAVVAEVDALGVAAWLAVSVEGDRLRSGEDVDAAFELAGAGRHVIAVGVNCSDPRDAGRLVRRAVDRSGKPAVVYPNSGEAWDPLARRWVGTPGLAGVDVGAWLRDGARLVGGCCRSGPRDSAAVAAAVAAARQSPRAAPRAAPTAAPAASDRSA